MKKKSNNKGITLIALVITIIVLLILAGITIGMLTGQNGILKQAQNSKQVTIQAKVEEMTKLAIGALRTENLNDTSKITPQAIAEQVNKDNNRTDVTASGTEFPTNIIYEEEGLQVTVDINLKTGEAEKDTSNSVYPEDIDESQIAPMDLFNFEPITETASNTKIASTGSLNDLPQKEARITGIKTEYCNLKGYDQNGQVVAEDTNYEIKYPGITDTLIIPYQVEIDGEMYKVTEVNLSFYWNDKYGNKGSVSFPNIEYIIYPNTVKKVSTNFEKTFAPTGYEIDSFVSKNRKIVFPNELTEVPRSFLGYSNSLESVKLPNKLNSIKKDTFHGCESLNNVVIPNNVTSIGENAFSYCTSLNTIVIPDTVTSIGDYAFSNCESLIEIKIPSNISELGGNVFGGSDKLKSIEYKGINYTSRTELETTLTNNNVKFYIWTFNDTGLSD